MNNHELALAAMSEAAAAINSRPDASTTLQEIVTQARRCLPEFEHVSIARVCPTQTLETLSATTDLARAFDAVQSDSREGPCIAATTDEEVVVVPRAQGEQRWPTYIGRALGLGLQSQIGVRLRSDRNGVICLNLQSTTHEDIDAGSTGVAEHFAVHAGIALGHLQAEEQLHTAIGTRTIIGTAVGILMERYDLTQATAFDHLVRLSNTEHRKVRLVASDIVAESERRTAD
jgi:GAF domain-containing protein